MSKPRVLVAGIGNIFFGDDAFGVEVARRLIRRSLPPTVRVVDFGIRGLDLAYALFDGYDLVILVDAAQRGEPVGTISVIEPCLPLAGHGQIAFDTHGMIPTKVLEMAKSMGSITSEVRLVCCEPATFGSTEEGQMGLSGEVAASIDPAVEIIKNLISEFLAKVPAHA